MAHLKSILKIVIVIFAALYALCFALLAGVFDTTNVAGKPTLQSRGSPRSLNQPSRRDGGFRRRRFTAELDPDRFRKAFDDVPEKITTRSEVEEYLAGVAALENDPPPSLASIIYFITPTHRKDTQWLDLVRLSQTLAHDSLIYWIVVEDATSPTFRVRDLLNRTGLPYAHVAVLTDPEVKKRKFGHRGVAQRNRALELIESVTDGDVESHASPAGGFVYFGDDDNAYDVRLFDEIRKTRRVGVCGVAFRGAGLYERCLVDQNTGKVSSLATNLVWNRKFPMDMGGYAFRADVIREKRARFNNGWPKGTLETRFVEQLVERVEDLEPLADNCRQILVWHVKTQGVSGRLGDSVKPDGDWDLIKNYV